MSPPTAPQAPPIVSSLNRRFAFLQQWGGRLALTWLLVAFALYAGGLLAPLVPLARVPSLLWESSEVFMRHEGLHEGWAWLARMGYADLLSLGSLVGLIAVVMVAYVGLIPLLVRRRDWLYLALVLLQLAVFAVATGALG